MLVAARAAGIGRTTSARATAYRVGDLLDILIDDGARPRDHRGRTRRGCGPPTIRSSSGDRSRILADVGWAPRDPDRADARRSARATAAGIPTRQSGHDAGGRLRTRPEDGARRDGRVRAAAARRAVVAGGAARRRSRSLFNVLALPRLGGTRLYRRAEHARGYSAGILLYPLSILLLLLLFPARPDIVAAAWGILAVGDGMAGSSGRSRAARGSRGIATRASPDPWRSGVRRRGGHGSGVVVPAGGGSSAAACGFRRGRIRRCRRRGAGGNDPDPARRQPDGALHGRRRALGRIVDDAAGGGGVEAGRHPSAAARGAGQRRWWRSPVTARAPSRPPARSPARRSASSLWWRRDGQDGRC